MTPALKTYANVVLQRELAIAGSGMVGSVSVSVFVFVLVSVSVSMLVLRLGLGVKVW